MRADFKVIQAGDSAHLLPAERDAFLKSVEVVRSQSGAARFLARQLLSELGYPNFVVLKGERGQPIWPSSVTGSITHAAEFAAVAVAKRQDYCSIGIDIEPNCDLPDRLAELVMSRQERDSYSDEGALLFFVVKEAVFKACYPLDGNFLSFEDIRVDLDSSTARTAYGRIVEFKAVIADFAAAVVLVPATGNLATRGEV